MAFQSGVKRAKLATQLQTAVEILMSNVLERSLAILELLAKAPRGLALRDIADTLEIPPSGVHRLLKDLMRLGYIRQERDHADYFLSIKLVSLGLNYLSETGIVDLAQPVLDRLASESGELVRLGVITDTRLTWVAKAQGARGGLIYDPDMGADAHLASSSSGLAWLMTLSDAEALKLVSRQGFAKPGEYGPNAPHSTEQLLKRLAHPRDRGFALTIETYSPGMNGMAAPVRSADGSTRAVVSIYGPALRFSEERMRELGERLLAAAKDLADVGNASPLMREAAST